MAKLVDNLFNRIIEGKLSDIASLEVGDVKSLTSEQINSLNCGDIVAKKDESGKHAYIVSYKKDGTGICLTYTDASCVETVSYDLVEGEWVYNSTDITPLGVSGTKLYKHSVTLTISDDEESSISKSMDIISQDNTKFTSYGSTVLALNGLMIEISAAGETAILITYQKPSGNNAFNTVCIGSLTRAYKLTNGNNYSAVVSSDTVTPL